MTTTGELNYFSIDGGSIENSVGFNAMNGVDVKRLDTSATPKGIFAMRNARLVASGLQTGFLFPLANVTKVILIYPDILISIDIIYLFMVKAAIYIFRS